MSPCVYLLPVSLIAITLARGLSHVLSPGFQLGQARCSGLVSGERGGRVAFQAGERLVGSRMPSLIPPAMSAGTKVHLPIHSLRRRYHRDSRNRVPHYPRVILTARWRDHHYGTQVPATARGRSPCVRASWPVREIRRRPPHRERSAPAPTAGHAVPSRRVAGPLRSARPIRDVPAMLLLIRRGCGIHNAVIRGPSGSAGSLPPARGDVMRRSSCQCACR